MFTMLNFDARLLVWIGNNQITDFGYMSEAELLEMTKCCNRPFVFLTTNRDLPSRWESSKGLAPKEDTLDYSEATIYTIPDTDVSSSFLSNLIDNTGKSWLLGPNFAIPLEEAKSLCRSTGEDITLQYDLPEVKEILSDLYFLEDWMSNSPQYELVADEITNGKDEEILILKTNSDSYILSGYPTFYRKLQKFDQEFIVKLLKI